MAKDIADLTLERVRRLEGGQTDILRQIGELRTGQTLLKEEMAGIHSEMAHMHAQMAHQSRRLDNIEDVLQRIATRLDLTESASQ